ncbi:MAG: OmpA family protein [Bacteroidota bacterium]
MRICFYILSVFFLFAVSSSASAQTEDIAGSEDHPLVTRYPGSFITAYSTERFFSYDLATGPITGYRTIGERQTVAGQLYRIYYEIPSSPQEVSAEEVYLDYQRAFREASVTTLAEGFYRRGSRNTMVGSAGWIGVALGPQPLGNGSPANKLLAGTSTSGNLFALVGQIVRPGSTVYIAIYGERHSDEVIGYLIDIIEIAEAETGRVNLSPDYLAATLAEQGSVSIYGLEFDFDSAVLKESSESVLEQIASFLATHPDIDLYVVGHTDMQGSYEYNLNLSKQRAASVTSALVDRYEIEADRLIPDGVGFLAPQASNEDEGGRAKNRRVELVKR